MRYIIRKSDWAAAQAKTAWEAYRELELTPIRGGNYARKREQLAGLRTVACESDRRVARYRQREAA